MISPKKYTSIATQLSKVVSKTTLHSRVHALRTFEVPHGKCYVKREDELGFGVSGTKARKYLSFLPHFLQEMPDEAIITGSAYSNHVLSLSQLLRERGVEPVLFLLGGPDCKPQGNLLYSMLIAESKNIHWIERGKWHEIDSIAEASAKERALVGVKTRVVPKGANCASALPGTLTLALDILRNEEECGFEFDHLFIDSGTGLTACALLLAFAYLGKKTCLHIVQIAGDKKEFELTLEERKGDFEHLLGRTLPSPTLYKLYTPSSAPAFGGVNTAIFNTVAEMARKEGFLTDPVFTAKLFHEGRKILAQEALGGNILFIHSGGGLGLTGFQEQMAKITLS
jgi:1-aminocyclopropane-1-carboxylate deaminase/D-cysteine desulfhydrase-like pyridoxal-dependent ACC family enzyme